MFCGNKNATIAYAFSPTNLLIQVIDLSDSTNVTLQNYDSTLSTNPTLPNLTSYSLSQYQFVFTLINAGQYETKIIADKSNDAQINLTFISPEANVSAQSFISPNCDDSVCIMTASTVTLAGLAGDVYTVNVTYYSSAFTQFQQFYITLRACQRGELNQTSTKQCISCPQGKYSLGTSDPACLNCPTGAECKGGDNIIIQPGYYRSANTTGLYLISCKDGGAICLGGEINTCYEGYTGPLCAQCDNNENYFTSRDEGCRICNVSADTYASGILLLIVGIIYQIYLVTSSFKKKKKARSANTERRKSILLGVMPDEPEKLNPADLMVIFTTFTQILEVFTLFDLGAIRGAIEAPQIITNTNKTVLSSLKCILYAITLSPFSELQLEILLYIFSPMIKILAVALIEVIRMIITRFREKKINPVVRLGRVAVVLTIIEQPNIIGELTNYFSCSKLDPYLSDEYFNLRNTVQCYTPEYYYFRNVAVIPGLIFWGVLVPFILFYVLYKKRHDLEDPEKSKHLFTVMGHLYSGYTKKTFYWGIFIICFKMLVFTLNSVLTVPDTTKCIIFLALIQLYYELLIGQPPYTDKILFKAEKYCSDALKIALLFILIKLSEPNISGLVITCEIFILIAAICGVAYILWHVARLYLVVFREQYKILKERAKAKKLLVITLSVLREYYIENDGENFEARRRRNAIRLDHPYQNQNTRKDGLIKIRIQDPEENRAQNYSACKENLSGIRLKSRDTSLQIEDGPTKQDGIRLTEPVSLKNYKIYSPKQYEGDQSDADEVFATESYKNRPEINMFTKQAKVSKSNTRNKI